MKQLTAEQEQALKELVAHNRKQVEAVGGEQNEAVGVIDLAYEEYAIYTIIYSQKIKINYYTLE